jgi:hypothetical protein
VAFAGLTLAFNGYVFGEADHAIHLCFLDLQSHPTRWDGDLLAASSRHHHSLFWFLQAPLAELLGVPLWTGLGYLAALVATGAAIFHLSMVLWKSRAIAILTLVVLAPSQFALGGALTLDPLLLNRTAALPLEVFAIAALVSRRTTLSFALLGLAANLHVPSASGLAAALTAVHLLRCLRQRSVRGIDWREALSPLACPLLASPVLARWLLDGGAARTSFWVDPAWRDVLELRMSHHLFASSWPAEHWISMSVWILAGMAALAVRGLDRERTLLLSLIAALCLWSIMAGEFLGAQMGIALALQLEPWQAFRLVTILSASGAVAGLWHLQDSALPRPLARGLLCFTVLLALLVGGPQRRIFLPTGELGEIRELSKAIATQVPVGARLLVPPVGLESLRWRTLRPQTLTWKDGGEALFDRSFALNWRLEMQHLCACDPFTEPLPSAGEGKRLAALRDRLREGHASLDATQLQDLATLLRTPYLVTRSELNLRGSALGLLHAGDHWSLYSVGASAAGASAAGASAAGTSEDPSGAAPR